MRDDGLGEDRLMARGEDDDADGGSSDPLRSERPDGEGDGSRVPLIGTPIGEVLREMSTDRGEEGRLYDLVRFDLYGIVGVQTSYLPVVREYVH